MDSQTTHYVGPILPNPPSPALLFSSRKPQKGKKKAHKMHHTPDFQQPVEPAQTSHLGPPPIDWEKRFSDMENATRITEIKHNTAIENQQKLITSLIARTLLPVSDHPHTPTRKRKHSKAMTPDDDLQTWDSPKTLLFKRRNLSNDDKSPEPSKRPTRFQKQQAANPNRKSGNRPDSEKEIASKRTATSPFRNLISDPETPLSEIQSPDACWNAADRENNQSTNSPSAKQQARKSQSPYQPEANSKNSLSPQKVSRSSLRFSLLRASQRISQQFSFATPSGT